MASAAIHREITLIWVKLFEGAVAGFAFGGFAGVVFGATIITDNWVNIPLKPPIEINMPQNQLSVRRPGISIKLKF